MRARIASALLLGALLNSPAMAADQLIAGRKLALRNPSSGPAGNKIIYLAVDPTISIGPAGGAGDPRCTGAGGGGTSTLRIAASFASGDVTIPLPCAGWTTNSRNTVYRYRDTTGTTCALVLVKATLVKAVCKGAHVAIDVNGGTRPTALVTTLNTESYCATFGGTVVKSGHGTIVAKNAPAPAMCGPAPDPPCEATTGGFCWFKGFAGASCDTVCTVNNRFYDPATASFAGSGGTDDNCQAVAMSIGAVTSFGSIDCGAAGGLGCAEIAHDPGAFIRCATPVTTATAAGPTLRRVCACM